MYDENYNDLSDYDPDVLEAEADLLLGENFGDDLGDEELLVAPHKKAHVEGEDELDDLDGYEDDLDVFDFNDDLDPDLDPEL